MSDELEKFYGSWQDERADLVEFDNECAARKIETILREAGVLHGLDLKSAIDFGCGRGKALSEFFRKMKLQKAYGFDFSGAAIDYASRNFGSDDLRFHRLTTLDVDQSMNDIRKIVPQKVDCILLIDLLEHVSDCRNLIARLSELTSYFIIKLPVESNILENYLLKSKIYPSTKQYNGHLREFDVNSVHYFIRALGLTPLGEGLYLHDPKDAQPQTTRRPPMLFLKVCLLALARKILSTLLHKKPVIALCGDGSYYCVATFDKAHVLNP